MKTFHVAVKTKNGDYKHFEVSEEVYIYIRQLETYILNPDKSKLIEWYSEKFTEVRKEKGNENIPTTSE